MAPHNPASGAAKHRTYAPGRPGPCPPTRPRAVECDARVDDTERSYPDSGESAAIGGPDWSLSRAGGTRPATVTTQLGEGGPLNRDATRSAPYRPSTIVWWAFTTIAQRHPDGPSTTMSRHDLATSAFSCDWSPTVESVVPWGIRPQSVLYCRRRRDRRGFVNARLSSARASVRVSSVG